MPINPRARVPAAVGLQRIIYPHRDLVRLACRRKMRSKVIGEAAETIRPHAERHSVDPHLAALIYAVELQDHALVARRNGQSESFSVPANAGGQICTGTLGGRILCERTLDAPVMRKIQLSPARIVERWLLRALRISLKEFPLAVKVCSPLRRRIGVVPEREWLVEPQCGRHSGQGCITQEVSAGQAIGHSGKAFQLQKRSILCDLKSRIRRKSDSQHTLERVGLTRIDER